MIDTHAHYNSRDLKDLRQEIINANSLPYLKKIINVGLDYETSKEAIDISIVEPKFYATIGVHPLSEAAIYPLLDLYRQLDHKKVVAVGETGLDSKGNIPNQTQNFIYSINLANHLFLPIIIHSNNANKEVMAILRKNPPIYGFVFHCFQPDLEIAKEIIDMGGYISVATPITRHNAIKSLEVIRFMPIENLLIELDYPYMSQNPVQDGRNVFNKIQEIRGLSHQELETQLDANARTLFKKLV